MKAENEKVICFDAELFGKKANISMVEVGKWFRFKGACGTNSSKYGKVVSIENGTVFAEKVFELPEYRPYGGEKWFDKLPFAIL